MAISDLLNRRVRAQPKNEDDEVYSEASASASASASEVERNDEGSDQDSDGEDDDEGLSADIKDVPENDDEEDTESDSDDDGNNQDDLQNSLNNISFGALAKAQTSLGPKKQKQKHSNQSDDDPKNQASPLEDIRARIREAREQKRQATSDKKTDEQKRTSKHAPMVQSSKRAVTRKRTVIEPPAVQKTRDPRFDPTVVGKNSRMSTATAEATYSFLNDYRAAELKELKEQLKNTKNAEQKESLKRAVRSATDRMRELENRKREQNIMADHKKQEKELIREGKKSNPYYMKKSDLKKQVLLHKYDEMNSKDRAKALERRRKKMTSKERRQMPEERRGLDGGPPPDREGGKKRKRAT